MFTIEWPTGADLDPVVLYAAVIGRAIEDVSSIKTTDAALARRQVDP